jgi:ribA/ribD-fused uncharacterized protein
VKFASPSLPIVREGYLLFWSGWPSNRHPSPFALDGREFNCVEQWMMFSKARYFGDDAIGDEVLREVSPRRQKELGRSVRGFDPIAWSEVSKAVVYRGVREKFVQNDDLRAELQATRDLVIVEASPLDTIWGIGLAVDHPDATNPAKWCGSNWLGELLMRARMELRSTLQSEAQNRGPSR